MRRYLPWLIPVFTLILFGLSACGDDSSAQNADSAVTDGSQLQGDAAIDHGSQDAIADGGITGDAAPLQDGSEDSVVGDAAPQDGSEDSVVGDAAPQDGSEDSVVGDAAPQDGSEDSVVGDAAPQDGSEDSAVDGSDQCQVWEITYDLTGSVFEISDTPFGAGDQVNTVAEPYDDDDHIGPGQFVLRFANVNGAPGGPASINYYSMAMHFVVRSATTVATDLDNEAGPEECGITSGALSGTTVTWDPSAIVGHHSVGQILCTGWLCGAGNLPNGTPVPVDDTVDQPLSDFVFSSDFSSFTMAKTVITQDQTATTSWAYSGTEVSRQLIAAPACLCP